MKDAILPKLYNALERPNKQTASLSWYIDWWYHLCEGVKTLILSTLLLEMSESVLDWKCKKTYNFLQNLLLFWPQQTSIEKVCFLPFEKKLLKGKPPESTLWEVLEFTQSFAMLRNVYKEMLQGRRQWGRASLVGFSELLDKWCQIYQGPKTFANTNGARFFKVMQPTCILHPTDSIALFTNIREYIWIGR